MSIFLNLSFHENFEFLHLFVGHCVDNLISHTSSGNHTCCIKTLHHVIKFIRILIVLPHFLHENCACYLMSIPSKKLHDNHGFEQCGLTNPLFAHCSSSNISK